MFSTVRRSQCINTYVQCTHARITTPPRCVGCQIQGSWRWKGWYWAWNTAVILLFPVLLYYDQYNSVAVAAVTIFTYLRETQTRLTDIHTRIRASTLKRVHLLRMYVRVRRFHTAAHHARLAIDRYCWAAQKCSIGVEIWKFVVGVAGATAVHYLGAVADGRNVYRNTGLDGPPPLVWVIYSRSSSDRKMNMVHW